MDIMCLMGLFPNEYKEEILKDSVSGVQNAANNLQWAIVQGLCQNEDVDLHICNSVYIGSFPKRYKKLFIPTFPFFNGYHSENVNVGFCNLSVLKNYSRYHSVKRYIRQWARNFSPAQKVLLIYALTWPFTKIAEYVRRTFPEIKVCIIVPDLPEYMNIRAMQTNSIYRYLKKISVNRIRKNIKDVDYYVLLTDQMKSWFKKSIRYTVVEGISSVNFSADPFAKKAKDMIYAGGISAEYGVIELIEAFMETDDDSWHLYIYGDGPDLARARSLAAQDHRVKIMGLVPHREVIAHQHRASLLVNPRKNQEFTKFSFPSKILEYLSSGTPMLAYKLDGVPANYDGYYYRISDTESLAISLKKIMCTDSAELSLMGHKAKEFVSLYKNPQTQCQRILTLLKQ